MVPVLCNMDMHSNCEWWIALESALKMHSLKSAALCICEAFRNGWKIRYGWIEIPAKFRGKVNINNSSSNNHLLILQPWLSVTPPPHHPYPHSEYPGKRTRDCKGVTRIGGGHSVSNRGYSPDCQIDLYAIFHLMRQRGLQRGSHGHPGSPLVTPLDDYSSEMEREERYLTLLNIL